MSLIIDKEKPFFDTEVIKPRDFIRAQYYTWSEPRNGLILFCDESVIQALFFPAIHQAACYFRVTADEIKKGKWKLTYISLDDNWNITMGGENFADEYNPAPAEDGSNTSEIIDD